MQFYNVTAFGGGAGVALSNSALKTAVSNIKLYDEILEKQGESSITPGFHMQVRSADDTLLSIFLSVIGVTYYDGASGWSQAPIDVQSGIMDCRTEGYSLMQTRRGFTMGTSPRGNSTSVQIKFCQ
jgi:hypothetical protein